MGKDTTDAISNVLSAFMTGQKEAENKRQWEAEFQLRQEQQAAYMNAARREQAVYEQSQHEKEINDAYVQAIQKANGIAPTPRTTGQMAIKSQADQDRAAAEDQARENEKAKYDISQRASGERRSLAEVESIEQSNKQSRKAKSTEDLLPDWLLQQYIPDNEIAQAAQQEANFINKQVDDLVRQKQSAVTDGVGDVKTIDAQLNALIPKMNAATDMAIFAQHALDKYRRFGKDYGPNASEDEWDEFANKLEAEGLVGKAQERADAAKAAAVRTSPTPASEPSTSSRAVTKMFGGDPYAPLAKPKPSALDELNKKTGGEGLWDKIGAGLGHVISPWNVSGQPFPRWYKHKTTGEIVELNSASPLGPAALRELNANYEPVK